MSSVILLVDDNEIQATTRQAVLEQSGERVLTASSGQAALDLLTGLDMTPKVGLVITDHLMPGMTGAELVQKIRQRGLRIPILVLSGLPDAEPAYQELNVTFRMKPCPPECLIELVHELLRNPMPRTA